MRWLAEKAVSAALDAKQKAGLEVDNFCFKAISVGKTISVFIGSWNFLEILVTSLKKFFIQNNVLQLLLKV